MNWLRQIFSRRRRYDDISVSIQEHLEEKIDELMEEGMSRTQAEGTARREFGNVMRIEERSREAWQWPTIESVLFDVKFSLRQFRKSPGFSLAVVIIMALGIGATTTVFSIVDAVVLRPLPYVQPQRLVEVKSSQEKHFESSDVSYPDFFDWRAQNHSFDHLVSYHDASFTLTGVSHALLLNGEIVSWDLLPMLGISPELGRGFTPDEERRGSRVLVISHKLWMSDFAGDKSVLGRTISLSGNLYTIVGVMPPSFRFPVNQPENSFWTTLASDDIPTDPHPPLTNRGSHFLTVIGRLKPGVTVVQADQDMKALAARLATQYPKTNTKHSSAEVETELKSLLGDTSKLLMIVLAAVGLVLLIACANIANLLLARMRDRQREIAMRCALGAGRVRVVRQLLAESLLQGVTGGLVGCAMAFVLTPVVLRLIGDSVPRAADAGVNLPVLAFALLVSLLSGVIFGIIPAVITSKTDLVATLKEGGRSETGDHNWLRSALVVGQVTLGIVLTVGAGLLVTSFVNLAHMDEGFNPDHLLTFTFELPDAAYKDTRSQFYRQYFERLRAQPGVQSAAGSHNLPMTYDLAMISFENPERPAPEGQQPNIDLTFVSTDYFRTIQTPLLRGRDFTDDDDMKSQQVMIVNQAFAQQYFPGEDVLGKRLKPGAANGTPGGPPWREIVGVVGNIRHWATQREMAPAMYLPASQLPNWCCLNSVVRTSVDPMSLESAVKRLVSSMNGDIPVTNVRTMTELLSLQLAQPRFVMILLGAFAGLALILTVVGLYGVMAYSVSRRTREIGIRLALGAQRNAVLTMVLRDAAILLLAGIGMGSMVSLLSTPMLKSMLYGAAPRDPLVLAVVCISVALAGLLAAYIPAFRAASIDPAQALRSE
ncbi:MAG TPA: ABC transporter permease [Edaphobacter sp.]|nr:ABC transporter permease [Edaphobacter sp.]